MITKLFTKKKLQQENKQRNRIEKVFMIDSIFRKLRHYSCISKSLGAADSDQCMSAPSCYASVAPSAATYIHCAERNKANDCSFFQFLLGY